MIAVILAQGWLRREVAEAELAGVNEPVVYAERYEELLPVKDEVEIILNTGKPDAEVIRQMPHLKWIFSYSAGVDMYPMELLKEKGVVLTNTSGVHKTNIAEQVLGAMILFSRNLLQATKDQAARVWQTYRLDELTGKQLLIIGAGQIGREIARKAKAFDMKVTGVRWQESREIPVNFDEMVTVHELHRVLPGKDYVCLVVPATDETIGLMGRREFQAMDRTAVFMNVGRGNTVREAELVEALQNGELRGAYLDVFEVEPLPQESPLWDLPNVFLTPHTAGPTPHYATRSFALFRANLEELRHGQPMTNRIDPDRKY